MIIDKLKYEYKDVMIVPDTYTNIKSRNEVNPYHFTDNDDWYLPIFTAPMSCVVDADNFEHFNKNHILSILPTTVSLSFRLEQFTKGQWTAFSMAEVSEYLIYNYDFLDSINKDITLHICIDCANGHMTKLFRICKELKSQCEQHGLTIEIMTGNIANPDVLIYYFEAGIDYIRCGIGGGSGCTTSSNTGVHYPMASLISECRKEVQELMKTGQYKNKVKIIADGGIRNYDDAVKALALGADYVMIGGLFTQCLESASSIYTYNLFDREYSEILSLTSEEFIKMSEEERYSFLHDKSDIFYHEVYGMSTKRAQKERGYENLKTSEGTQHFVKVNYTLQQWVDNMDSYLRSAMSYTDCGCLDEFTTGNINLIVSPTTQSVINK